MSIVVRTGHAGAPSKPTRPFHIRIVPDPLLEVPHAFPFDMMGTHDRRRLVRRVHALQLDSNAMWDEYSRASMTVLRTIAAGYRDLLDVGIRITVRERFDRKLDPDKPACLRGHITIADDFFLPLDRTVLETVRGRLDLAVRNMLPQLSYAAYIGHVAHGKDPKLAERIDKHPLELMDIFELRETVHLAV